MQWHCPSDRPHPSRAAQAASRPIVGHFYLMSHLFDHPHPSKAARAVTRPLVGHPHLSTHRFAPPCLSKAALGSLLVRRSFMAALPLAPSAAPMHAHGAAPVPIRIPPMAVRRARPLPAPPTAIAHSI